jgi:hypothetical protein
MASPLTQQFLNRIAASMSVSPSLVFLALAAPAATSPESVPYDGQLVYLGPSQPGWRFHPAKFEGEPEDVKPLFAAGLDDGKGVQSFVRYHLLTTEKQRRRLLARLRGYDEARNGSPTDEVIQTSIDGRELIFVRRRGGPSQIYVLPAAERKVTPSLCVIQLPAETRRTWPFAMPMSFDWCRKAETFRFGVRKVRLD